MTLYFARIEETEAGREYEAEYEVEVDYAPGRPAPRYDGSDATKCDPGDDEEFEIESVVRVYPNGMREDVGRFHLDDEKKALRDLARDAYEPPERDEDEGSER